MELINAASSPETQMNGNFQTLEWAQVYGRRVPVTTGLTWGYYGGVLWGGIAVVDGTLILTNTAANYIVVNKTTGAISVTTAVTNWNDAATYARVYKVTTAAGVVSAVEDHRAGAGGLFGGGGGGGALEVADTLPAGLTQGEQWYESDTAGFYMRYVNPDATETLVSLGTTGGDFVPMASKGAANGVPALDATGTIPIAQLPPVNATNRIINGKFAIDQRNAGAAMSAAGVYGVDRWVFLKSGPGAYSSQRAPDNSEFYLSVATGIADPTLSAGSLYWFQQKIEGVNIADFRFGTAAASPITLAFEVQSSRAGQLSMALANADTTRSYVATFTVGAGVGWEKRTLTIPGDTTGIWLFDNRVGLVLSVPVGVGATFTTSAVNVWNSANFLSGTGSLNLVAGAADFLFLRNVRLYKGAVDFGPDQRLYAEELALCQRYYCKSYEQEIVPGALNNSGQYSTVPAQTGVGTSIVNLIFPVTMRTPPTVTLYSSATGASGVWNNGGTLVAAGVGQNGTKNAAVQNLAAVVVNQQFNGHFTASAEL